MYSFSGQVLASRCIGYVGAALARSTIFTGLLALGAAAQAITLAPLNDTGLTLCYDGAGAVVNCASSGSDDGRYGRDAAASAGLLGKIGAGAAGFDFSKIANDGSALAASAALGTNPTDWACTRDNVTGLIWEVKTTSGLRSSAYTYTWYSSDVTSNGGNAGSLGTDTCGGTLSAYANQCNTVNYVAAVNAAGLCGAADWRVPTIKELNSIVDYSRSSPTIDPAFFPNTPASQFWSTTNAAGAGVSGVAWIVNFSWGGPHDGEGKSNPDRVRLVRASQ